METTAKNRSDILVIGGGLSGLTAASLLAKRGLFVRVLEQSGQPGGSCGIFKRGDFTFDQGSAMLYGFGEKGFNAHRFVFNCLEEPIDVLRHNLLYVVNYNGRRVRFFADVDRFAEELSGVFPSQRANIRRFYHDMRELYEHIMVETPTYTSADETDPKSAMESVKRHPKSYIRFLSYLNRSAKWLLRRYFDDPEIFKFFDKLTSTYCYATVEEAPAVLAAVMFVDNHIGGSFYPAGSTLFLPGKLEKVIEEYGGELLYNAEAAEIQFKNGKPCGARLADGRTFYADELVYSGTVWNLYGKLLPRERVKKSRRGWAEKQQPTYPSVVLYAAVDAAVIPPDTAAIEMLVGSPDRIDESEVTAYILSVDDRTLCPPGVHTVIAIGPSFQRWDDADAAEYARKKEFEKARLLSVLERRFPGFAAAAMYAEVATPRTIERYTLKNGGAVAGPKQMLGQHMFRRQHIRAEWDTLFCCGESTVMGTGTPTVTISGLSAANAILKKRGLPPFVYEEGRPEFVRVLEPPFLPEQLYANEPEPRKSVMTAAMRCRFCERPSCCTGTSLDVPGVMRRAAVGNFAGARILVCAAETDDEQLAQMERRCVLAREDGDPAAIRAVFHALREDSSI